MRLWPLRRAASEATSAEAMTTASRGQPHKQVLRPARAVFIWGSLVAGLALDLLPWGRTPLVPDFLALVLVFWNIHQPRRVGMAAAFLLGLLMDVHDGALFGEHALAYTLLSYGAIAVNRRILWLPVPSQSLYVLPLLLVAQLASAAVRLWVGGYSSYWWTELSESVVGALLWSLVTWIMLAPQRRSLNRDDTRPL
jgi:rod shape-determining protein MreD